ncbi:MAG: NAD(P)H-dependent oxidoreductase subunit E [Chloroflexi bacterium]|nr:NAD(P)H-dependent oxidoreductase subunit E [Chloroflexota bacterium]
MEISLEEIESLLAGYTDVDGALLPILHEVQERYGYISDVAVETIAKHLRISPAQIYGMFTYYTDFRSKPPAKRVVTVCQGLACRIQGGLALCQQIKDDLGLEPGGITADGELELELSPCLGICTHAPVIGLNRTLVGRVTKERLAQFIFIKEEGAIPEGTQGSAL